jgi:hypothetical protein
MIIYECLFGVTPFYKKINREGKTDNDIIKKLLNPQVIGIEKKNV